VTWTSPEATAKAPTRAFCRSALLVKAVTMQPVKEPACAPESSSSRSLPQRSL
jgi:hypothetical protein